MTREEDLGMKALSVPIQFCQKMKKKISLTRSLRSPLSLPRISLPRQLSQLWNSFLET